MAKVLGVGGIFFKSPNPQKLYQWYSRFLGMEFENWGTTFQPKDQPSNSLTVWSAFEADTDYFSPSDQSFMFNLIVDDLDEALRQVQEGGAQVIGGVQKEDYGSFGWFLDPDGNKVELWEPAR